MQKVSYREWSIDTQRYWGLLGILAAVAAVGGLAALYMEHSGHWVTGMTNLVVWGTPHMFAVFLIVAASGALNVASIGSVFGKPLYKPLARLSGLLAIALLVGGLLVLVLDLGRPDRLIVAMTTYNFKSIFAWNIYLYVGFMVIVAAYLFTMMERRANQYAKPVGVFAFVWRLALTTGTGSIFGFLVARQAYDSAILAPMFIIMSFAYGLAIYLLVLMFSFDQEGRPLGDLVINRLKNLLGVFIAAVLLFSLIYHLTKLYGTKYHGVESYLLLHGGSYSLAFWFGHVLIGALIPLGIIHHPALSRSRTWLASACGLVVLGGLATMYVVIIGSQTYPLEMFPGMTVLDEGFGEAAAQFAPYHPSVPEFLLGLGGMAVALLATAVAIRMLKFLPESLSDEAVAEAH
jgi:molybdopterin-containing oxidoreductase family membrane subunit